MADPQAQVDQVALAFVQHYYTQFDTVAHKSEREKLRGLYQDASKLTWEGEQLVGAAAIINKFTSLKFDKVSHQVSTIDASPSGVGGALVLVAGVLKVDDNQNGLRFSHAFHLLPAGQSFWVHNEVFRLNYG